MSPCLRFIPLSTILALILSASFLLAACGGSQDPTRPSTTTTPTPQTEPTQQPGSTRPETEPTRQPATATPEPAPTRQPRNTQSEERVTPNPTDSPPLATASSETDKDALFALYNSTGGPNWEDSNNWLSDAPLGEWHGVTTGNNGRVIDLQLHGNQLTGQIPPELGNLANLGSLYLHQNQLTGEIPPDVSGGDKVGHVGG